MSLPRELEERLSAYPQDLHSFMWEISEFLEEVANTDTGTGEYLENRARDLLTKLETMRSE